MKRIHPCILCFLFIVPAIRCQAQQPIISPDVHPDSRVTFRLRAPNAQKVMLAREGAEQIAMEKNEEGVWSIATDPLEPDIYGYSFVADGVNRDFFVYTPPGHDPKAAKTYPTLYLLHGFSDDASAWTAVGCAERILDNLIAQGKARPMLVIMPLGYGAPEIIARTGPGLHNHALRDRNCEKFRDALLTEVMPEVERWYLVARDRESRAIAGLSMGGTESLFTGLNVLDGFAWVGVFSSGGLYESFDVMFPALSSKVNTQLRLLWISCGKEDHLIEVNRKLIHWLDSKGIQHTTIETSGSHTWMVWRRNLVSFVQLLFQER